MVTTADATELRIWAAAVLEAASASPNAASVTARHLVNASRRGLDSHGVVLLNLYVPRLRSGAIAGSAEPTIAVDRSASAVVDGASALGAYVADFAMQHCCTKARQQGAAVVAVRNSSHFGAASCYAELAAQRGCIGFAFSNSDPGLAPAGALGPLLGTNPFAIAGPPGVRSHPPSLDIATSVVAQGRVKAALRAGEKIPSHWAIGPDGVPTTDPERALQGALLPMGEHKGFALAFMIDILTGCLSGAKLSPEITSDPSSTDPLGTGHCFMALNVAAFVDPDDYADSVDRLCDAVHQASRQPATEPFLVPGERESRVAEGRADRIPIDLPTRGLLEKLGSDVAVPFEVALR